MIQDDYLAVILALNNDSLNYIVSLSTLVCEITLIA